MINRSPEFLINGWEYKNETKQTATIGCITSDPEAELLSFMYFWKRRQPFDENISVFSHPGFLISKPIYILNVFSH